MEDTVVEVDEIRALAKENIIYAVRDLIVHNAKRLQKGELNVRVSERFSPHTLPPVWTMKQGFHPCDVYRTIRRVAKTEITKTFAFTESDDLERNIELHRQLPIAAADFILDVINSHPEPNTWFWPTQLNSACTENGKKWDVQVDYCVIAGIPKGRL